MALWLREVPLSSHSSLANYWDPFSDYAGSLRQLDRFAREMEHSMGDMNRLVNQLLPVDMRSRQAEAWHMDNPIVTDNQGNRKLQLRFDVRQFKPEEITIKTKDNQLEIHAKHEESNEQSKVFREYHRTYSLPKELNVESLKSSLNRDGVLTVEAPLPALPEASKEKTIPIEHTK